MFQVTVSKEFPSWAELCIDPISSFLWTTPLKKRRKTWKGLFDKNGRILCTGEHKTKIDRNGNCHRGQIIQKITRRNVSHFTNEWQLNRMWRPSDSPFMLFAVHWSRFQKPELRWPICCFWAKIKYDYKVLAYFKLVCVQMLACGYNWSFEINPHCEGLKGQGNYLLTRRICLFLSSTIEKTSTGFKLRS